METKEIIQNEATAEMIPVTQQPDGPGLRMGKKGELTMIGNLLPGGAEKFRERVAQFQAEANYYESRVGTVQDFRGLIFDNDTRFILTVVYDGDFKPYLDDIATHAGPWLDALGTDVLEGYPGMDSPHVGEWVVSLLIPAEFFWAANSHLSGRDIKKIEKVAKAVDALFDAAQ